jgi:hypothetical protein
MKIVGKAKVKDIYIRKENLGRGRCICSGYLLWLIVLE